MPKTDLLALTTRADLYDRVRTFFRERAVLEIDAPLLSPAAVTDIHIESIPATVLQGSDTIPHYLITSPEFYMKRLLAGGSGAIYYLGKVFRQGEHGRRHHHEFTMLEWYRPGWDEHELMQEVVQLLQVFLAKEMPVRKISYSELFRAVLQLDPCGATTEDLKRAISCRIDINLDVLSRDDCLELLFTHCLEPTLKGITFVHDYPASQSALAALAINHQGQQVARRFEVFLDDLELGNGYFELTDACEQRKRFQRDLELRREQNKSSCPIDEHLLQALEQGLPPCAGVALGIDRLLMKIQGKQAIQEVWPLPG